VQWITARWNLAAVIQYVSSAGCQAQLYLIFLLVAEVVSDWVIFLLATASMMVNIEHVLD
jgi:hypothetical protein